MGYMHIDNLYKNQTILLFREVWALEKIHGTSAHVAWDAPATLRFHPGGVKHDDFAALFDGVALLEAFTALGHSKVVVFGEAYGGSCQRMFETYGPLKFVVFDVKIGETWLDVPAAHDVAGKLGLEFVHYERVATDVSLLNAQRDSDSVQAVRNGRGAGKMREGVVLRPISEVVDKRGNRIIAKHKRAEFSENKKPREIDPEKRTRMTEADAIADDWVTDMRLAHVLDKIEGERDMKLTPRVISAMQEDVKREAGEEILWSKDVERAVGTRAVMLYKRVVMERLVEPPKEASHG